MAAQEGLSPMESVILFCRPRTYGGVLISYTRSSTRKRKTQKERNNQKERKREIDKIGWTKGRTVGWVDRCVYVWVCKKFKLEKVISTLKPYHISGLIIQNLQVRNQDTNCATSILLDVLLYFLSGQRISVLFHCSPDMSVLFQCEICVRIHIYYLIREIRF